MQRTGGCEAWRRKMAAWEDAGCETYLDGVEGKTLTVGSFAIVSEDAWGMRGGRGGDASGRMGRWGR